jgi:hypothetical protein
MEQTLKYSQNLSTWTDLFDSLGEMQIIWREIEKVISRGY